MTGSTVVLITGVSRGIGRGLVEAYLSRPNHIVIGSVRDKTTPYVQELESLPAAEGSRLLLIKIESTALGDPAEAIKDVEAAGIDHIDVVIANAGGTGGGAFQPLDTVSVDMMTQAFNVNALGPVVLYQAVYPLLQKSKTPKWISISSAVATIGNMETRQTHIVPAYGAAKAALNWVTVAAHSANKWLIAVAMHPGFVQTDLGNSAAKKIGLEKATTTTEECIDAITRFVDNATREKSSGKFVNVIDGTEIPW
ncbi:NAD(P)-binding protein [Lipomyces kononenkoae]